MHEKNEGLFITCNLMTVLKKYDNFEQIAARTAKAIEEVIIFLEEMDPIQRAERLYKEADLYISNVSELEATPCKKSCSHCCYQFVAATNAEVALIAKYVKEKNIPIRTKTLKWQSKYRSPEEYWKLHGKRTKCVFLKDSNDCAIYPVRPLGCRAYYSAEEDATNCTPDKDGNSRIVAIRSIPEVEMLISAISNVENKGKKIVAGKPMMSSMANLLLKLREKHKI